MRYEVQRSVIIWTFVALAVLAAANAAEEPHAHTTTSGTPETVVDAFHEALSGGHRDDAIALLAADAVIFESGGAEMSPAEYAHHHLEADMEFSAATERQIIDRQTHTREHAAWVLTRGETRGTFRGRDLATRDTETIVLVHGDDGWRIAHVHWSSTPLAEGE